MTEPLPGPEGGGDGDGDGRRKQASLWIRIPAALLVPVGSGALIWWCGRIPYPDREEAEADIESTVGAREGTDVDATCEEPDESGFSCRLRDGKGRYGHSSTSFRVERRTTRSGNDRFIQDTSWDFPIDHEGMMVVRLDRSAPGTDLNMRILLVVATALVSFGPEVPRASVECPHVRAGATAACAVSGSARTATLRDLGSDAYELTVSFILPDHP
jgi:hypothetical protein